jgi:hypothetical protein
VNGTSDFPAPFVDVSGAGVPARDAAGGGKGRPATLDQDVDAGFAGRRAGTPAPLFNFPFTRLPWALFRQSCDSREIDYIAQKSPIGQVNDLTVERVGRRPTFLFLLSACGATT